LVNPQKSSGWIKIAFIYAIHFLISNIPFEEAIRKIISVKGDTDTNACIIGALLGASYGIS
jgi:ADP-ribosyl-[dinitrogen reductase] hydrolase